MPYGKVEKEANTKSALHFLVTKGWTQMQAAAIIGNLTAESYMNPETPRGDDGSAMGLAQWRGDRLVKFQEIIGKHCEDSSLEEQLSFVNWELNNTNKKAGNLLRKAPDLEIAVGVIDKYYERSAGIHLDRRIKFAKEALENYGWLDEKEQLDEKLDEEVKQSMHASDPLSQTQPGTNNEPVPSSGFPEKPLTFWQRLIAWLQSLGEQK